MAKSVIAAAPLLTSAWLVLPSSGLAAVFKFIDMGAPRLDPNANLFACYKNLRIN